MSRLINPSQTDRFRAIFQKELTDRHVAGEVDDEKYKLGMMKTEKDFIVHRMIDKANQTGDFNWVRIVDWMKEHWFEVLKAVLTIAILFLDEQGESQNGRSH